MPIALLSAAALFLGTAEVASGHERRAVAGYEIDVGMIDEPVVVGQPSGVTLVVMQGDRAVEGLERTIEVDVVLGDARRTLALAARPGDPGAYEARFVPTAAGAYTFRIRGSIEGTPVEEVFTAGPGTFEEVGESTAGQFPVRLPTVAELADDARRGREAAALMPLALLLGGAGFACGLLALGMVVGRGMRRRDPDT